MRQRRTSCTSFAVPWARCEKNERAPRSWLQSVKLPVGLAHRFNARGDEAVAALPEALSAAISGINGRRPVCAVPTEA